MLITSHVYTSISFIAIYSIKLTAFSCFNDLKQLRFFIQITKRAHSSIILTFLDNVLEETNNNVIGTFV